MIYRDYSASNIIQVMGAGGVYSNKQKAVSQIHRPPNIRRPHRMKIRLVREHDQKHNHHHNHTPRQVPSPTYQVPLRPHVRNHQPFTLTQKLSCENQHDRQEQKEHLQVKHRMVDLSLQVDVRRNHEEDTYDAEY